MGKGRGSEDYCQPIWKNTGGKSMERLFGERFEIDWISSVRDRQVNLLYRYHNICCLHGWQNLCLAILGGNKEAASNTKSANFNAEDKINLANYLGANVQTILGINIKIHQNLIINKIISEIHLPKPKITMVIPAAFREILHRNGPKEHFYGALKY